MEGDTCCKRAVQTSEGGDGAGTRTLAGGSCRELLAADWQLFRKPFSGITLERRRKYDEFRIFVCLKLTASKNLLRKGKK